MAQRTDLVADSPIVIRWRRGFPLACAVLFLAITYLFASIAASLSPDLGKLTVWIMLAVWLAPSLLCSAYFLALALQPPRLALSPREMTFVNPFRSRHWQWDQIGAPRLDRYLGKGGVGRWYINLDPDRPLPRGTPRGNCEQLLEARWWEVSREDLLEAIADARRKWIAGADAGSPNRPLG